MREERQEIGRRREGTEENVRDKGREAKISLDRRK